MIMHIAFVSTSGIVLGDSYRGALFSRCMHYRYALWRLWAPVNGAVLFVMLNPSTADHKKDDNTITKCGHYATKWGFGGFYVVNLFAWRDTSPQLMMRQKEPVGEINDLVIKILARDFAKQIVCAWGNHGNHLGRDNQVVSLLARYDLCCLKQNGGGLGQPAHPLYLRGDLLPSPFVGEGRGEGERK